MYGKVHCLMQDTLDFVSNFDSITKVVHTHHKFSKPKQKHIFFHLIVTEGVSFLCRRMNSAGAILVLFLSFQDISPRKFFLIETEDKEAAR